MRMLLGSNSLDSMDRFLDSITEAELHTALATNFKAIVPFGLTLEQHLEHIIAMYATGALSLPTNALCTKAPAVTRAAHCNTVTAIQTCSSKHAVLGARAYRPTAVKLI